MDTIVPYLIALMVIIGIWMLGRYLYRTLYLRKYVLKDLDDINDAFAALVKEHNKIVEKVNLQDSILNKVYELTKKQAETSQNLRETLERVDKVIKEIDDES